YTYTCRKCRKDFDVVNSMKDARLEWPCPKCHGVSNRVFKKPYAAVFHDYVTADITGEPVHVKNRAHENDLCKIHGVARATMDDTTGWGKRRRKPTMPSLRDDFERTKQEMQIGTEKAKELVQASRA